MTKFLNIDHAICLSPHPDDIEFSMGGTILANDLSKFDIAYMSWGGKTDPTSSLDRVRECVSSWGEERHVGTLNMGVHHLCMKDENEWITYLEEKLDMDKYDTIFYPSMEDIHFEHRNVASIGQSLGRNNAYTLIEYQTPSTAVTWIPNLISDITLFFEDKVRMLTEHFESQSDKSYFQPSTIEAFHRHYRWMRNNPILQYAEEFKIVRMFA